MCDPVTIIATAGAAVSAYGAYNEGKSQQYDLEAQGNMARYQADQERAAADEEARLGAEKLQDKMMADNQAKSKAALNLAGRGLSLDGGSTALDALDDLDFIHGIENERMSKNAGKKQWGHMQQANLLEHKGATFDNAADNISPGMMAVTSLLGSAQNFAG